MYALGIPLLLPTTRFMVTHIGLSLRKLGYGRRGEEEFAAMHREQAVGPVRWTSLSVPVDWVTCRWRCSYSPKHWLGKGYGGTQWHVAGHDQVVGIAAQGHHSGASAEVPQKEPEFRNCTQDTAEHAAARAEWRAAMPKRRGLFSVRGGQFSDASLADASTNVFRDAFLAEVRRRVVERRLRRGSATSSSFGGAADSAPPAKELGGLSRADLVEFLDCLEVSPFGTQQNNGGRPFYRGAEEEVDVLPRTRSRGARSSSVLSSFPEEARAPPRPCVPVAAVQYDLGYDFDTSTRHSCNEGGQTPWWCFPPAPLQTSSVDLEQVLAHYRLMEYHTLPGLLRFENLAELFSRYLWTKDADFWARQSRVILRGQATRLARTLDVYRKFLPDLAPE